MQVKSLIFNPFQENTLILYDGTKECAIVDPGMLTSEEEGLLTTTIQELGLKPVKLLQTHLHLDHVFGTAFVTDHYGLEPEAHEADLPFIDQHKEYARTFGVEVASNPPKPRIFLKEGDEVKFGDTTLQVRHIPGHSPGGIVFYNEKAGIVIAGDALFSGSVGRSDLPGGNHEDLISSIHAKLMSLPDEVVVYPGHGPKTSIGQERTSNPYL
ncbi:MBL fold metallo-hydrolase [Geofilum rubicundum]|uniref:Hydroxyacylglutathione hydrolase n=1 Tax=Geofilum rubicundum JCM 15548 TaxID=1236989 RepID=A0A0E9LWK3_9BACT|nr:MBL fold metallo-hydrolase [Geofilum rubicundum]GAO29496.1 hydroxyacylglutathione hydrolase [Geofilum rubicundum JCM 15548]